MMAKENNILWLVVEDGLTGTENQLRALEDKLTALVPNLQVMWHKLQRGSWLFPRMDAKWYWESEAAKPDLVLASGRLALFPSLGMKSRGANVAFVQDPRWFRSKFDVIYCPAHDRARGGNVVLTEGTLTRIGRCDGPPQQGTVFVIIGGARKGVAGTLDMAFTHALKGKKVMVTFSRRTPEDLKSSVRGALPDAEIYDPADGGHNPYREWLCQAEVILATNDSTGMISDAASTGRAVYTLDYIPVTGRFKSFHDHVQGIGAVRRFAGDAAPFVPQTVLEDADKTAKDIAARFFTR